MPDPFTSLLDLDRGRLPDLMLRLDGKDVPAASAGGAGPWATAFRLGVANRTAAEQGHRPRRVRRRGTEDRQDHRAGVARRAGPGAGVHPAALLHRPPGGRLRAAEEAGRRPRPFLDAGAGFFAAAQVAARFGVGLRAQLAMPVAEWAALRRGAGAAGGGRSAGPHRSRRLPLSKPARAAAHAAPARPGRGRRAGGTRMRRRTTSRAWPCAVRRRSRPAGARRRSQWRAQWRSRIAC